MEEVQALGVRRAAQRKLKHELGIEAIQVSFPFCMLSALRRDFLLGEGAGGGGFTAIVAVQYFLLVDVVKEQNKFV